MLVLLAGMFDACMDIRRDNVETFLANIFGAWFIGGNDHYSLPIWGPYDFWHFSKSCLMACWSLIAVSAFFYGIEKSLSARWYHVALLFFGLYWIQALSFTVFYHAIFRL